MREILSPRLEAIASKVRMGDRVLDVGTDHGYIPIYLVQNGISPSAIAADIKEQPLERARANIRMAGLCDKIRAVQTNGVKGIDEAEYDCVVIAGMGGVMIADIIAEIKEKKRLVLQPMTKAAELREYLYSNGYEITNESLAGEGDKIYVIISAVKTGKKQKYSMEEVFFGREILNGNDSLKKAYIEKLCNQITKKENGIRKSKNPDTKELESLKELIKDFMK